MPTARILVVGLFVVIIAILSGVVQDVRNAQAIPAFARKYDFACNVCIVYTPGLKEAGFGTGSSLTDNNLESAFVRVMNLERFLGGAENTYLMNLKVGKFELDLPFSEKRAPTLNTPYLIYHFTPFGTINPFGLGDNQPGIELTGIKRTDLTGGYFRYSLGG